MKKNLPKILSISLVGIALALLAVVYSHKVNAQESIRTITISPPSISLNLNPGEKTEGTLKLINNGDAPLTFSAETRDFIVTDTQGTPHIVGDGEPQDTRFQASSWLGVYPGTFTVQPHQKQELSYFIQVPYSAKPGGHYAAVVYTPVLTGGAKGSGTSINSEMGTLFLIGINGPITENAIVSFFSAPFTEYGPVNLTTQIQNLGDLHIRPVGNIIVTDMLGKKEIAALDQQNIFPGGGARNYTNVIGKGFMLGRYEAKLAATYGRNNDKFLVATVAFWVFPWKITLVIILIIVAIILYFKLMRKKKITKETPEDETAN